MLLELARPVSLFASMFSLLAVFHAAFFGPETDITQRLWNAAGMLLLAAGVSLIGGLVFRRREANGLTDGELRLFESFPVQVFCWGAGIIAVLFLLAWWVEAYCFFNPRIRF